MPAKAVRSSTEIVGILQKYRIFHENKKLKKKKFKEPDGSCVWVLAQKELAPMELQNLYLYVRRNSWGVRTILKNYHFPKAEKVQTEGVPEILQDGNESDASTKSQNKDDCAVQENKNELTKREDEYDKLHQLKFRALFEKVIHRISIIKFCVSYWSIQQTSILKDMLKKDGHSVSVIVLKEFLPIIQLKNYASSMNSLVSIACTILDKTTFVANLITESLDDEFVQRFIMDFFKKISSLPSEIIVGYHRSTMEEICFALNTCSMKEYNSRCLAYLEGKRKVPPKILLSIDLITILFALSNSPDFQTKPLDIQKKLLKIIIYLKYNISNLKDFQATVTELLLLMFSPFKNKDSLAMADSLEKKIESQSISFLYDDFRNFNADDTLKKYSVISSIDPDRCSDDLIKYIKSLEPNINEKLCEHGTPNPYYSKTWYTTTLLFILAEFPSWTCLLNQSARDMNLIKKVSRKQVDFIQKNNNSPTISKFLEMHMLQCDEHIQRRRAFLNQKRLKKSKDTLKVIKNVSHLNYQENWGGLNTCLKKKEKTVQNICDETQVECDLTVSPSKGLLMTDSNACTEINVDEKSQFPKDELADLEPVHMSNNNLGQSTNENLLGSSDSQNEEFYNNSCVLAGSVLTKNANNSSITSQTWDLTISSPNTNSTPTVDRITSNSALKDDLLSADSSTHLLLNKNINSNMDTGETSVNIETTSVTKPLSPHLPAKRPLKRKKNKNTGPPKKKRKAVRDNKKKKFVGPCPDMGINHAQARNSRSNRTDRLICNGSDMEPRSIKTKKYELDISTSKFDVLVEILAFGYKNCMTFRRYCDSIIGKNSCSDICLLNIAIKFSKKGNKNSLYADRVALLSKCAITDESLSKITINEDLRTFFRNVMIEHASYVVNVFCKGCKTTTAHEYFVIDLSDNCNLITNLQTLLYQYLAKNVPLNNCGKCKKNGSLSLGLGSYLAINFADGSIVDYVNAAPKYINFSTCMFMLSGVVTIESKDDPMYVAYCRGSTGFWDKRNGKKDSIVRCSYLTEENIVLLVYLKIEANDINESKVENVT